MKQIFVSALVGALVAAAVLWAFMPRSGGDLTVATLPESAYDRVMRTNTLRCGIMPWAPYWVVDVNTGAITGMAKDFFDGLAAQAQFEITYVPITFGTQSLELSTGRIDAVCNDGPWILSSAKVLAFTTPYYYTPMHVYVRGDDQRFKSPDDLNQADVTLVALEGDSSLELAVSLFPKATVRTIGGQSDSTTQIMDVITGKVDATVIDALSAQAYNQNNPRAPLKRLGDQPVAAYPGGMSVAPEEMQLLQFLSTAIDSANATGLTNRVLDRYDPQRAGVLRVTPRFQSSP